MALEISGNTVDINGNIVAVSKKPKYKGGQPKTETRTAMVGKNVVNTQSRDYSEAYSVVTVTLRHTPENIALKEACQEKVGKNAIRILDEDTGFIKTFNQCSVEEDPEHDFDGEDFEIVFHGNQAV